MDRLLSKMNRDIVHRQCIMETHDVQCIILQAGGVCTGYVARLHYVHGFFFL